MFKLITIIIFDHLVYLFGSIACRSLCLYIAFYFILLLLLEVCYVKVFSVERVKGHLLGESNKQTRDNLKIIDATIFHNK